VVDSRPVSWKLRLAAWAVAFASIVFPLAFLYVPFNTGLLRCGTPIDDAYIDITATVERSGVTDPGDQVLLVEALQTCKDEARQRIGGSISVALMILVVDGICLAIASDRFTRSKAIAQHELLHFA
jgi:hypothetical protein